MSRWFRVPTAQSSFGAVGTGTVGRDSPSGADAPPGGGGGASLAGAPEPSCGTSAGAVGPEGTSDKQG